MPATPATAIQHIFADKRPFAQCHASTLVQFADATFLAAWFGGSKESKPGSGAPITNRDSGRLHVYWPKHTTTRIGTPSCTSTKTVASTYSSRSALRFPIGKPGWSNRMTAANTGPSRASW